MIITKSVSASTAISRVIARQMADVLVAGSVADLRDEDACVARLTAHGFGSLSIANVGDQARALASEIVMASAGCRRHTPDDRTFASSPAADAERAGYRA
ncbi:MAG: hypothetical protein BGO05_05260 [Rhizobiales bacterium 63-7]|nr:hypothetical protein [Hyphomicrobiales bacterium]OJU66613.1 MAG: hypothetical protein BGO05_05260 [Rhizobiales bacterium 63-7]